MTSTPVSAVRYNVNRLTVEAQVAPAEFQSRYEQAVPLFPDKQVKALVEQQAPWQEMLDLANATAPHGFLIFYKNDVRPTVRLAGDQAYGVAYLMGNHTIMERMFRHEPAILLYAPLHTVIWGDPDGPTHFTFDKPSDQFASFANPDITAVGEELDHKMAALLKHLDVAVPDVLLTT
jgi:hypothetical protein